MRLSKWGVASSPTPTRLLRSMLAGSHAEVRGEESLCMWVSGVTLKRVKSWGGESGGD